VSRLPELRAVQESRSSNWTALYGPPKRPPHEMGGGASGMCSYPTEQEVTKPSGAEMYSQRLSLRGSQRGSMRGSREGSTSGHGSTSRRGSGSEGKRRGSVDAGNGPRVNVGAFTAGGKVIATVHVLVWNTLSHPAIEQCVAPREAGRLVESRFAPRDEKCTRKRAVPPLCSF